MAARVGARAPLEGQGGLPGLHWKGVHKKHRHRRPMCRNSLAVGEKKPERFLAIISF